MFARTAEGMELIEVAPGIDIERDILAHMDFRPIVRSPRPMDARIFRDEPMQLDDTLLGLRLEDRISYDAERNLLFLNLEGMALRTRDDVDRWRRVLDERLHAHRRAGWSRWSTTTASRSIRPWPTPTRHWCATSTPTTTPRCRATPRAPSCAPSSASRCARRSVAPHIFESAAEAHASAARDGATSRQTSPDIR